MSTYTIATSTYTITHYSPIDLGRKFVERLKICRDGECFSACWNITHLENFVITIRSFDGKLLEIEIVVPTDDPKTAVRTNMGTFYNEFIADTDPLNDASQFEELYSFMHHLKFGLCKMRNNCAGTPLSRLEQLEAYVKDLQEFLKPDELTAKK